MTNITIKLTDHLLDGDDVLFLGCNNNCIQFQIQELVCGLENNRIEYEYHKNRRIITSNTGSIIRFKVIREQNDFYLLRGYYADAIYDCGQLKVESPFPLQLLLKRSK